MKKQNILTVWAKRAVPALALAGATGLMLPSCDKEPDTQTTTPVYRAPYEKELLFGSDNADSIAVPVVKRYADDTACKKNYLTTKPRCDFTNGAEFVNKWRTIILEPALAVSEKVTGRGNIYIYDKPGAIYTNDSIWFVQNGWNVKHF